MDTIPSERDFGGIKTKQTSSPQLHEVYIVGGVAIKGKQEISNCEMVVSATERNRERTRGKGYSSGGWYSFKCSHQGRLLLKAEI